MKLTAKQTAFVEAYCGKARGNATEAARLAGYSQRTCGSMGAQNLKKLQITKAIAQRTSSALGKMSADDILQDIAKIARSGAADKDRLRAYELLGKNLGLWVNKVEVTGADGGPVTHQLLPMPDPVNVSIEEYGKQAAQYALEAGEHGKED